LGLRLTVSFSKDENAVGEVVIKCISCPVHINTLLKNFHKMCMLIIANERKDIGFPSK
jgi:hypothetical protein